MRFPSWCGVAAVLVPLIAAPTASAAIPIGELPAAPGAVTFDSCAQGTYAVTSTAVPPRYEIPGDGVLTSWRTYSTILANVGPERLKVITPVSATTFKVVAVSPYVNAVSTVDNSNTSFPTRIPVRAGDLIALGVGPVTSTQSMPHCLFNNNSQAQWRSKVGLDDPPAPAVLTWGPPPASLDTYRVSVSAVLEPDLDHDAFGDETQDRCATVAGTENGCPPPATPPVTTTPEPPPPDPPLVTVSAVTVSPKSFRAARSGSSVLSGKSRAGTKVSIVLDQDAAVQFTVARTSLGRTASGGRCVAITSRNRKSRKCTRLVPQRGSFTRSGLAGTSSFRFSGRMDARTLKPGKYRLIATPAAKGRTGAPVSATFSIVK